MNNFLQEQSDRLNKLVLTTVDEFEKIPAEKWNEKPNPDKWSKKEILGHLTDSAANNHLRFVRAQIADGDFISHGYEQNFYVTRQHYQYRKTEDIILLWKAYNLHLAHVIKHIDSSKLGVICKIGNYGPQTFSFIIKDYIDHIEHHLAQIMQ